MEKTKPEENRTAYDGSLARLDRQMREVLRMGPQRSGGDKPQALPEAGKTSA